MNHDMKEMVESWHARLGKQIVSCRKVRDRINKEKKPEQAAMLAGKTKAYVEMRCFLESKYGKCMPYLLTKRQDEQEGESPNKEFRNGGPVASDCNRDAIPPFPETIS